MRNRPGRWNVQLDPKMRQKLEVLRGRWNARLGLKMSLPECFRLFADKMLRECKEEDERVAELEAERDVLSKNIAVTDAQFDRWRSISTKWENEAKGWEKLMGKYKTERNAARAEVVRLQEIESRAREWRNRYVAWPGTLNPRELANAALALSVAIEGTPHRRSTRDPHSLEDGSVDGPPSTEDVAEAEEVSDE